jgi:hypothetical protein
LLLGISGSAPADNPEEVCAAEDWAYKIAGDITKAGLAMDFEYINFAWPGKNDGVKLYGREGVKRLENLKLKSDPGNVFACNTPDLSSP